MENKFTAEQIETICVVIKKWLQICESNGKQITPSVVETSSLLRRLLSGKEASEFPPPYRFGFPAWELLESEEVQIQEMSIQGNQISIDGHDGYILTDPEKKIIKYPRLNLSFQCIEKEIVPNQACIDPESDPTDYKYTAKFLKKHIDIA